MNLQVSRALESSGRFLARVARYLGPLLRDTGAYLWRLSIDAFGGLRILFMHWGARRNPARTAEYSDRQARLRLRRTERWRLWREVPSSRRMAIRGAAAVLASILFVVARGSWSNPSEPEESPSSPAATNAAFVESTNSPPSGPVVDVRQAVARFTADRQRLGPGEWAVLREVPTLERGALGAWDDHVVAVPVVVRVDGAEARYRMWFRGCHMAMREFSCGVGHARSSDGVAWEKTAKPVFVPEDPQLQESLDEIAVVNAGGRYYLWYSVMADYFSGRRRAALYLATSVDGLAWKDEGQVVEAASENPPTIAPAVLHDGQRFHLWYVTSVPSGGRTPIRMLQHLSSADGKTWSDLGGTPLHEALNTVLTPDIRRIAVSTTEDGRYRAYTYDSSFGALTSADGTTWTKESFAAGPLTDWSKEGVEVHSISGLRDAEGLWLWMDIRSAPDNMQVGVAFQKGSQP